MADGILLYNVFVEENEDNKYRLNVEELYLWSVLRRLMNYNQETITSVNFIDKYTRQYLNTYFYKKVSDSRTKIKECLLSLQEKGLIHIDSKLKSNNELFKVTFAKLDSGYDFIPFSTFDNINVMEHLYIHFTILKWKGTKEGTFNCSNKRWMKILGVESENTVKKYIKQCEEKGLLYRVMGDYTNNQARYGQSKQDEYKYKTTPFTEEEKSNMQRKKEREGTDHSTTDTNNEWGESDNKYPFDTGNWLNKNNLDVDDYVIYLKHKNKSNPISKDFIAECNQKRNRLDKNGKFKMYIEKKLIEQALEEIEHQKQKQNELIEEQARQIIDETDDVVVLVDGKLLPYAKWNKKDKVEKVYYLFGKWVSQIDSYVYELYSEEVVDNEDVERFRPDKNGEWDNEEKQLKREMELEIKSEKEPFESEYYLDDFNINDFDIDDFEWGQSPQR